MFSGSKIIYKSSFVIGVTTAVLLPSFNFLPFNSPSLKEDMSYLRRSLIFFLCYFFNIIYMCLHILNCRNLNLSNFNLHIFVIVFFNYSGSYEFDWSLINFLTFIRFNTLILFVPLTSGWKIFLEPFKRNSSGFSRYNP